jgi:outer membrane protein TolC
LAQTKLNIGSGSSLELLQAKVDGNEQRAALLKQLASLQESKDNLNYLLSQKVTTTFIATDTIHIVYAIPSETLLTSVQQKNYSLLAAQRDENISMQTLKEVKALRMPTVNFTTGYNYSKNKSDAGFMLFNQNTGYNYGLSLKWNVFDGFNTSRQIKNAELNYRSAGLYYNDLQLQVNVQVQKAMRDFSNALALLQLEQENSLLANENLTVAFERFRSGLSNSLELKAAQLSYQNSLTRLIQTQYAAKLAETELMRLNGEFVK